MTVANCCTYHLEHNIRCWAKWNAAQQRFNTEHRCWASHTQHQPTDALFLLIRWLLCSVLQAGAELAKPSNGTLLLLACTSCSLVLFLCRDQRNTGAAVGSQSAKQHGIFYNFVGYRVNPLRNDFSCSIFKYAIQRAHDNNRLFPHVTLMAGCNQAHLFTLLNIFGNPFVNLAETSAQGFFFPGVFFIVRIVTFFNIYHRVHRSPSTQTGNQFVVGVNILCVYQCAGSNT